MKHEFTLIYHTEQKTHFPSRERVAYLLKAARSRGLNHRPQKHPSGDIVLHSTATIFRHTAANPRKDPAAYYLAHLNDQSIEWEEIPTHLREQVLDLAAKESRQNEGLGGGWNQSL